MLIPYLPTPQPDEILGSWLARIKLHNGDGLWQALLKTVGYAILQKSMLRIPDFDPRLERLLGLLGMSFKTALLEHTHMRYVMAFEDVHHAGLADGVNEDASVGSPVTRRMRYQRHLEEAPRYCPECLAEAFVEAEPFWRLSHQLPNVAYCSLHETALLSACEVCTAPVGQAAYRLVAPLPLRCTCGHRLTERLVESPPEPYLHRAIRLLSIEATRQPLGRWSSGQLRAHIQQRMRATGVPAYIEFLIRDEEGYPTTIVDDKVRLTHEVTGATIVLKKDWGSAGAPELCGLMAMLGRTFQGEAANIEAAAPRSPNEYKAGSDHATMESRLSNYVKKWRLKRGHDPVFSAGYWHFRLQDPRHLEMYADLRTVPIPSVEHDRQLLEKKLAGKPATSDAFLGALHSAQPVYMRMKIRDSAWLASFRASFVAETPPADKGAKVQHRLDILAAIEALTAPDLQPLRLTSTLIAHRAQLPARVVRNTVSNDPSLLELVESWNDQHLERASSWAIGLLHKEGMRLHPHGVMKRAGLSQRHMETIKRVLHAYVETHGLQPDQYLFRRG